MAAIDLGFDITLIGGRPKLIVKFLSVMVLTLNGLLRHWCFPRLSSGRSLGMAETALLMVIGAVSTASWLTAAFISLARSLVGVLPLAGRLSLYGAALGAAVTMALAITFLWRRRVPAAMLRPADVSAPIQIEPPRRTNGDGITRVAFASTLCGDGDPTALCTANRP